MIRLIMMIYILCHLKTVQYCFLIKSPCLLPKLQYSREMLDILTAKNMEDARQAKARGDLVCWASSIAPCEFTETMGIYTVYPENHAVGIAARKETPERSEEHTSDPVTDQSRMPSSA